MEITIAHSGQTGLYHRCIHPGRSYRLIVNPSDTIYSVKVKIQQEIGDVCTIDEQRLFSKGFGINSSRDSYSLQECGIEEDEMILLLFSMIICEWDLQIGCCRKC